MSEKKEKVNQLANLDAKSKFLYIFLCIITLSIFYFYVQSKIRKVKKQNEENNNKKEEEIQQLEKEKQESKPKKTKKIEPKNNQKTSKVNSTVPLKQKIKEENKKSNNSELNKTKTPSNANESNLKVSNKLGFDLQELITALGGLKNITSTEASLSSLKVMVVDKQLVNQDAIKKLGARGLMISGQKSINNIR